MNAQNVDSGKIGMVTWSINKAKFSIRQPQRAGRVNKTRARSLLGWNKRWKKKMAKGLV